MKRIKVINKSMLRLVYKLSKYGLGILLIYGLIPASLSWGGATGLSIAGYCHKPGANKAKVVDPFFSAVAQAGVDLDFYVYGDPGNVRDTKTWVCKDDSINHSKFLGIFVAGRLSKLGEGKTAVESQTYKTKHLAFCPKSKLNIVSGNGIFQSTTFSCSAWSEATKDFTVDGIMEYLNLASVQDYLTNSFRHPITTIDPSLNVDREMVNFVACKGIFVASGSHKQADFNSCIPLAERTALTENLRCSVDALVNSKIASDSGYLELKTNFIRGWYTLITSPIQSRLPKKCSGGQIIKQANENSTSVPGNITQPPAKPKINVPAPTPSISSSRTNGNLSRAQCYGLASVRDKISCIRKLLRRR